jgi:hypothetical protein
MKIGKGLKEVDKFRKEKKLKPKDIKTVKKIR